MTLSYQSEFLKHHSYIAIGHVLNSSFNCHHPHVVLNLNENTKEQHFKNVFHIHFIIESEKMYLLSFILSSLKVFNVFACETEFMAFLKKLLLWPFIVFSHVTVAETWRAKHP